MARAFTDREKEHIDVKLRSAALQRFSSGGCRKTTVDELSAAAGVSKGAFYIFYPSKEALFYRVLMDYHGAVKQKLLDELDALSRDNGGRLGPDEITAALTAVFREVESSFLPAALANGEMEYLASRLGDDALEDHQAEDADFVSAVFSFIPGLEVQDIPFWGAMLRGIFTLMLHRREIGEEHYDRVMETMIRQAVAGMTGPKGRSI